ncbi:MAG: response regulator, partial [Clostridia bacterium]|nr:response regulator [Clostridia bacterium]
HTVEGIHRISWEDIQKPDKTIYGGSDGCATGIAKFDGRLITILDFEKIVADIAPATSIRMEEVEKLGERARRDCPIVLAEDSMLLSKLIQESLTKAGYTNVTHFPNGSEALDYIKEFEESPNVIRDIACLITDIEMPVMDGHRLTKIVKDHPVLQRIPVVIFSSLIDDQMRSKGAALGADAQLSKPEIGNLIQTIDGLVDAVAGEFEE